jgi:hypothetical protein
VHVVVDARAEHILRTLFQGWRVQHRRKQHAHTRMQRGVIVYSHYALLSY